MGPPSVAKVEVESFRQIDFGLAAAENEKTDRPHLLLHGFLDTQGYTRAVVEGNKFLVLGPKGSGKSAIGSRIELLAQEEHKFFATSYYLTDFPYHAFPGVLPGQEAPETKYPENWEFLLQLCLVNSFARDSTFRSGSPVELKQILGPLKDLGLFPSQDLGKLVKTSSRREFKVKLTPALQATFETEKDGRRLDAYFLVRTLEDFCTRARPGKQHIVIIDGLDDALTKRNRQYDSLLGLVVAVDRLNRRLRGGSNAGRFVLLCRTDLFDKLQGPNKNKILQDHALELNWFNETNPDSTNLAKLVNLRASLALKRDVDVFQEFFPEIGNGNDAAGKMLLEQTRHLPRDIVQLMNYVQRETKGARPTYTEIKNGVRLYSQSYLVPEIRDELCGFLDPQEVELALQLLSKMHNRQFTFLDLQQRQAGDKHFAGLDLEKVCNGLYEVGAVGNLFTNQRGGVHFNFKFRNRYTNFDRHGLIVVNHGLCRGLGIS